MERVPAITYTWDPTKPAGVSSISYLSPQIERILGYTPQEWMDDPEQWIRCIHPEDRDRVVRQSDAADAAGRDFIAEYRALAKDGGVVWVHDVIDYVGPHTRAVMGRAQEHLAWCNNAVGRWPA